MIQQFTLSDGSSFSCVSAFPWIILFLGIGFCFVLFLLCWLICAVAIFLR